MTSRESSGRSDIDALRSEIIERAVAVSHKRNLNWRERLPQDLFDTFASIKRDWQNGGFASSASALARTIRAAILERGHDAVSSQEIRKWLTSN